MVNIISREELKAKIDRGDDFVLAEVLAPAAYRGSHLPGAINIPPDQFHELVPKLLPDKNKEVIFYCSGPT